VFGFIGYANGSFTRYQVNGSWSTQFFHRNDNGATVGFYIDSTTGRKHGLLLSDLRADWSWEVGYTLAFVRIWSRARRER
jgi:hypothetical protein